VASFLLENPIDVTIADNTKKTPLHEAALQGQRNIVKRLLDLGADVNALTVSRSTPLIEATSEGHLVIVRILLEAGAHTGLRDQYGMTAAMWAEEGGHIHILYELSDGDPGLPAADLNGADDPKSLSRSKSRSKT